MITAEVKTQNLAITDALEYSKILCMYKSVCAWVKQITDLVVQFNNVIGPCFAVCIQINKLNKIKIAKSGIAIVSYIIELQKFKYDLK